MTRYVHLGNEFNPLTQAYYISMELGTLVCGYSHGEGVPV